MRHLTIRSATFICGAVAAASLAAAGAALAQTTVEELTVIGKEGPKGHAESLSYKITWHDLDLRTKAGQKELDRRIRVTAKYVCDKLGEAPSNAGYIPSCEKAAVQNASHGARDARIAALRSTKHWKPGPPWTPPPGMQ
jgi:UrcA family protein